MMRARTRRVVARGVVLLAVVTAFAAGCRRKDAPAPPVATPSVAVNHDKAALGSPIEVTYTFLVASDAKFDEDYLVMLHVVDADEELIWTDDHKPPTPTSQWKPGQTIEYRRTIFIPVYPYVGETTLQVGLYSPTTQKRLPLAGEDAGQRAYKAGKLQLQPQTENLFTVEKDGWNQTEVAEHNAAVEWRWTKKQATLAFKNPRKNLLLYLDVDNPGGIFTETQHVRVTIGDAPIAEFDVTPPNRDLHKIPVQAAQLGTADMAEIQISVDKTFVPAVLTNGASKDPRELGIRVFHAFIEPVR